MLLKTTTINILCLNDRKWFHQRQVWPRGEPDSAKAVRKVGAES